MNSGEELPDNDILYERFPVSQIIITNVLNIFTLLSGSLLQRVQNYI